jgi:predicted nucleic acid-binding protein
LRVTLDANVLVYAAQRGERRHGAAALLVRRAVGADCVQTLQSFGECFNVLRRKRGFEPTQAQTILREYREILPRVVGAMPDDLDEAMRAHASHGLQFWDAMLWATAKRAGCRLILTDDFQDGRTLEGVLFVDPFKPENARLLDLALPPTIGSSP